MSIRIVTDSTCDLPEEVVTPLQIAVVPLYINIGDQSFQDGVEITRTQFYTNLPTYPSHPTTGTPGPELFKSVYNKLVDEGATEILSIHISESLSATVDVARTAAKDFQRAGVTVLDSRQLSMGTGFQVEIAARMAMDGNTMEEILATLEETAPRIFVAARLSTLEFLRRSGRMNATMSGIGSLLQLKPILKMSGGEPTSERVRTYQKAEKRLVELLGKRQPIERFALLHTNAPREAELFRKRIDAFIPDQDIYSMNITPVIGAHIGPGAIGYAIISTKRN